jgi:hypothetical protein
VKAKQAHLAHLKNQEEVKFDAVLMKICMKKIQLLKRTGKCDEDSVGSSSWSEHSDSNFLFLQASQYKLKAIKATAKQAERKKAHCRSMYQVNKCGIVDSSDDIIL